MFPVMTEKLTPQDSLDEPHWEPEIETEVELGTMTTMMADQGLRPIGTEPEPAETRETLVDKAERAIAEEVDRLEDAGYSHSTARKMMGIKDEPSQDTPKHPKPVKSGWVKDKKGIRRKIRTAADARAADSVPDDE